MADIGEEVGFKLIKFSKFSCFSSFQLEGQFSFFLVDTLTVAQILKKLEAFESGLEIAEPLFDQRLSLIE